MTEARFEFSTVQTIFHMHLDPHLTEHHAHDHECKENSYCIFAKTGKWAAQQTSAIIGDPRVNR